MYCLLFYTCIKMLSNDGKICFAITYKNGKTLNGLNSDLFPFLPPRASLEIKGLLTLSRISVKARSLPAVCCRRFVKRGLVSQRSPRVSSLPGTYESPWRNHRVIVARNQVTCCRPRYVPFHLKTRILPCTPVRIVVGIPNA